MIHEEICTYEVAKLAKEKGFDVPTLGYYRIDREDWYRTDVYDDWNDSTIRYSAPTQSLLQRWLREEKGLCISVEAYPTLAIMGKVCFAWVAKSRSDGHFMKSNDSLLNFSTYELALEDALKYALENLI